MLNAVYQLVRPRQFEVTFSQLGLDEKNILVRPTYLSICNADQRYYQGKRSEDILRQKLPMALSLSIAPFFTSHSFCCT